MTGCRIELEGRLIDEYLVGVDGHGSFPRPDELTVPKIDYEEISRKIAPHLPHFSFCGASIGEHEASLEYAKESSPRSGAPFDIRFSQIISDKTPADCIYIAGTMKQERSISWNILASRQDSEIAYKVHQEIGPILEKQSSTFGMLYRMRLQRRFDLFVGRPTGVAHAGCC